MTLLEIVKDGLAIFGLGVIVGFVFSQAKLYFERRPVRGFYNYFGILPKKADPKLVELAILGQRNKLLLAMDRFTAVLESYIKAVGADVNQIPEDQKLRRSWGEVWEKLEDAYWMYVLAEHFGFVARERMEEKR